MSAKIQKVLAREVLDSRGDPTVFVEVQNSNGTIGRAFVPAGASTGKAEAKELRDADPDRYAGRGVRGAVRNVREVLAPLIMGRSPTEQIVLDQILIEADGTPDKSRLGANAILGVSLAVAHAGAAASAVPLFVHLNRLYGQVVTQAPSQKASRVQEGSPRGVVSPRIPLPMINMISGGLHAGGNLDFQDFLIVPNGAASIAEGLEWTVRVYRQLGAILNHAGFEGRLVGDEGGYGPRLQSNRQAVELIVRAVVEARLVPGDQVSIAIDVASSHFFDGQGYRLTATGAGLLSADEMIDQLESLVIDYPIWSIEDALAEEDWEGWQRLTARLGGRVRLVGDDFFATNPQRIQRGGTLRAANSVLIKLNQIGTLTETLQAIAVARDFSMHCVVSARSGETEDFTIADLATGTAAEMIKIGSIVRGERLAKYNRLLEIEERMQSETFSQI